MNQDPHETGARRPAYSKDLGQEEFFEHFNLALQQIDLSPVPVSSDPKRLPLIYIIGAPRSGTTLLSQLVSRFLPVGYINNLIARFWLNPSIGIRISNAVLGSSARNQITLSSTHGSTQGTENPHEFGYFWRYWLGLDRAPTHHLGKKYLESLDSQGLKNILENGILSTFDAPVVFKNVICGFQASYLSNLHPASTFIYISRDPAHVAASILKVRKERYGSYDQWWSLKPAAYPYNTKDAVEEVVCQVVDCRREMELEISRPDVRSINITYEQLCHEPHLVIEKVCAQIHSLGYDIQPVSIDYPTLNPALMPSLPKEIETRLEASLSRQGLL